MELRHLRYFLAVAEELHFGRAAARLHISQPPLSQQIRALEDEAGVQLFRRGTRHVALTPAGVEFVKYARAALSQVEQGLDSAQRVHRGEVGRLSVGFITSMAYTYLPWVVTVFRQRYPLVELVLTEQESWNQLGALQEHRLDVGIVRGPVEAQGVEAHLALDEAFVVALPADHPLAKQRTVKLSALAREPFILFPRAIGGRFYDAVYSLFEKAGFTPVVAQEAVQMHVAVGLVSARLGAAIVPASVQLLSMPGVVYRPLNDRGASAQLAVAHASDNNSPVVPTFRQAAIEVISGGIDAVRAWRNETSRSES